MTDLRRFKNRLLECRIFKSEPPDQFNKVLPEMMRHICGVQYPSVLQILEKDAMLLSLSNNRLYNVILKCVPAVKFDATSVKSELKIGTSSTYYKLPGELEKNAS